MRFWWKRKAAPVTAAPAVEPHPAVAKTLSLMADNDLEAALACLLPALEQAPDEPSLLVLRSELHRRQREPEDGIACCDRALLTAARPAIVQFELAECHLAMSALTAAVNALNVAVTLEPRLADAWYRLGETLLRQDHYEEALTALLACVDVTPNEPLRAKAQFHIGQCHFALNRIELARDAFQASLNGSASADALTGLGHAYLRLDQDTRAITAYEEALHSLENPSNILLLNLGCAYQHAGNYAGAREVFQKVITRSPSDHHARWYLCQLDLLECRWEQGWANYSARFAAGASPFRPMPFRRWNGRPSPEDTLLVLADEGLGDEIMFASCTPDLSSRMGHVILECDPRLGRLFQRSFPQVEVIATQRRNQADWLSGCRTPQWQIPSGDLPSFFRNRDEDFPRHSGFLKADPERVTAWTERLDRSIGAGLKVGLSWRGGTDRTRIRARTIQPETWGPILNVPDVHFVNLQYGNYSPELTQLEQLHGVRIHDFPEAHVDYDETAALVCSLDLVITVCTAVAHLSGAIGKEVWVLTPHAPGWRYTAGRNSMPWYPSSRIFRQPAPGDWAQTCRELALALKALTN